MSGSGEGQYPDVWSVYLASQDLGATVQAVAEAGGQLLTEPVRLDGRGSMALFLDPGGAAVGAWQPAAHQGFGLTAEAGAPVWFELATREYEAAVRFYAAAFGWQPEQMSDTDQFRYTLNGPFDRATAGIYDAGEALPEGDPSHWMVYLGAPDTDDAVQRVRELGGSVRRAPWDSPYGRMAQIADPTGAVFAIVAV
jgi:predicted enzyme related to lactoylglutathione lyase